MRDIDAELLGSQDLAREEFIIKAKQAGYSSVAKGKIFWTVKEEPSRIVILWNERSFPRRFVIHQSTPIITVTPSGDREFLIKIKTYSHLALVQFFNERQPNIDIPEKKVFGIPEKAAFGRLRKSK